MMSVTNKYQGSLIQVNGGRVYSRTASDMDGTLHTDLAGFENIRDIKKVLYNHFNNLKS